MDISAMGSPFALWTNIKQVLLFEQFQGKFSRMVISIDVGSNHNCLNVDISPY